MIHYECLTDVFCLEIIPEIAGKLLKESNLLRESSFKSKFWVFATIYSFEYFSTQQTGMNIGKVTKAAMNAEFITVWGEKGIDYNRI